MTHPNTGKLETKLLSWGKTYAAVLMGLPTEQTLTEASAKLQQILRNTSNTDSRELEEIIRFNINAPLIADARIKDLVNALSAYIANKQRELLEWVEQEVVGPDNEPRPDNLQLKSPDYQKAVHEWVSGRRMLRAAQREQLKNKKESL